MGIIRSVFDYAFDLKKIVAMAFIAGATIGYCSHDNIATDSRYRVERREKKPYLIDKLTHDSVEIMPNMQLGSPEYRIEALLREDDLKLTIDEMSKKYKKP